MRISRIQISNFRNFESLEVEVDASIVIVGENRSGKSNLLHALRLVLDPSLPDSARHLRIEDFWDGLGNPVEEQATVEVAVDITEFRGNEKQECLLADYIIEGDPETARLGYIFEPAPTLDSPPQSEHDYEFRLYGGDDPARGVRPETRRRLPLDVLPALRDAESDMASWSKSPLRPLLDRVVSELDGEVLAAVEEEVASASESVLEVEPIAALAGSVNEEVDRILGADSMLSSTLRVSPTTADRLIRSLRLFIDDGRRAISEASLGSANLIYLALKSLHLQSLIEDNTRDHTFLAIEEPEAHLHPHVQRRVYRSFLRQRAHQVDDGSRDGITPLLTTHSPHVASVTPLRSVVLLRRSASKQSTSGHSLATLELDEGDLADLERFVDVHRGEIFFSQGVLLVEGDAESYLIPVLADVLGFDLDALGILVSPISGTHFLPYAQLLDALEIPYAVLTDRDPNVKSGRPLGERCALRILREVYDLDDAEDDDVIAGAPTLGVFLNEDTLEVDIANSELSEGLFDVLAELAPGPKAQARAEAWRDGEEDIDRDAMLKDVEKIGKGRVAQRLASVLASGDPEPDAVPNYIREAVQYVVEGIGKTRS